MKLSVLIPMHNAEAFVNNCLISLINQDLSSADYEIIVMDDGSTDNCFKIVNEYVKVHNNIFLYSENNAGSDSTRNKLLKLAKGEYVYFIDADDYLAYNSLGLILEYLQIHNLDFIGFDTLKTNYLTHFLLEKEYSDKLFSAVHNGLEYIRDNRNLRHEVWWYIVKKSLIDDNNIVFDENGNNTDVIFTIKLLLKANRLAYCSLPIHRYVQTKGSVMRGNSSEKKRKLIDSMFNMIISYSELINSIQAEILEDKEIILENLKFRRDVFTFFNIINMLRLKYRKEIFQKRIIQLDEVNAYPVNNFLNNHYNTLKFSVLNKIINNKAFLLNLVKLRNTF
jgi:glycosyltransferase involved in cell wall biosynthesis